MNIRGSTGFGYNFQNAADCNWFGVIEDIMKAIDWAQVQGIGTRPIVMGSSFGGYAAAAAYAKGYTDVAIAINGTFDLEKHRDDYWSGRCGKTSTDNVVDALIQRITSVSAQVGEDATTRKANSVTTYLTPRPGAKMLIIAGRKDNVCSPAQSDLLYARMLEVGNYAEYITMSDEGHSPTKPENIYMINRVIDQFIGSITGYPYEAAGYETLRTTPGVWYQKTDEERVESKPLIVELSPSNTT